MENFFIKKIDDFETKHGFLYDNGAFIENGFVRDTKTDCNSIDCNSIDHNSIDHNSIDYNNIQIDINPIFFLNLEFDYLIVSKEQELFRINKFKKKIENIGKITDEILAIEKGNEMIIIVTIKEILIFNSYFEMIKSSIHEFFKNDFLKDVKNNYLKDFEKDAEKDFKKEAEKDDNSKKDAKKDDYHHDSQKDNSYQKQYNFSKNDMSVSNYQKIDNNFDILNGIKNITLQKSNLKIKFGKDIFAIQINFSTFIFNFDLELISTIQDSKDCSFHYKYNKFAVAKENKIAFFEPNGLEHSDPILIKNIKFLDFFTVEDAELLLAITDQNIVVFYISNFKWYKKIEYPLSEYEYFKVEYNSIILRHLNEIAVENLNETLNESSKNSDKTLKRIFIKNSLKKFDKTHKRILTKNFFKKFSLKKFDKTHIRILTVLRSPSNKFVINSNELYYTDLSEALIPPPFFLKKLIFDHQVDIFCLFKNQLFVKSSNFIYKYKIEDFIFINKIECSKEFILEIFVIENKIYGRVNDNLKLISNAILNDRNPNDSNTDVFEFKNNNAILNDSNTDRIYSNTIDITLDSNAILNDSNLNLFNFYKNIILIKQSESILFLLKSGKVIYKQNVEGSKFNIVDFGSEIDLTKFVDIQICSNKIGLLSNNILKIFDLNLSKISLEYKNVRSFILFFDYLIYNTKNLMTIDSLTGVKSQEFDRLTGDDKNGDIIEKEENININNINNDNINNDTINNININNINTINNTIKENINNSTSYFIDDGSTILQIASNKVISLTRFGTLEATTNKVFSKNMIKKLLSDDNNIRKAAHLADINHVDYSIFFKNNKIDLKMISFLKDDQIISLLEKFDINEKILFEFDYLKRIKKSFNPESVFIKSGKDIRNFSDNNNVYNSINNNIYNSINNDTNNNIYNSIYNIYNFIATKNISHLFNLSKKFDKLKNIFQKSNFSNNYICEISDTISILNALFKLLTPENPKALVYLLKKLKRIDLLFYIDNQKSIMKFLIATTSQDEILNGAIRTLDDQIIIRAYKECQKDYSSIIEHLKSDFSKMDYLEDFSSALYYLICENDNRIIDYVNSHIIDHSINLSNIIDHSNSLIIDLLIYSHFNIFDRTFYSIAGEIIEKSIFQNNLIYQNDTSKNNTSNNDTSKNIILNPKFAFYLFYLENNFEKAFKIADKYLLWKEAFRVIFDLNVNIDQKVKIDQINSNVIIDQNYHSQVISRLLLEKDYKSVGFIYQFYLKDLENAIENYLLGRHFTLALECAINDQNYTKDLNDIYNDIYNNHNPFDNNYNEIYNNNFNSFNNSHLFSLIKNSAVEFFNVDIQYLLDLKDSFISFKNRINQVKERIEQNLSFDESYTESSTSKSSNISKNISKKILKKDKPGSQYEYEYVQNQIRIISENFVNFFEKMIEILKIFDFFKMKEYSDKYFEIYDPIKDMIVSEVDCIWSFEREFDPSVPLIEKPDFSSII